MIARLALIEGGIAYESVVVDIHVRMVQQQRICAAQSEHDRTTLVLADRILDQSRDIAEYALGVSEATLDGETKAWLDLHYGYPIEELTFGGLLAAIPGSVMIPKRLKTVRRRLLERVARNPDLAKIYEARAAVFAGRVRAFDPRLSCGSRRSVARSARLHGSARADASRWPCRARAAAYGVADVVWTVFLARMEFVGMGAELQKRPALARYWRAMQTRPSFAPADIWTKLHVFRLIGGMLGIG